MKESFEAWVISPPNKSYLSDFKLRASLAFTEDKAWEKFCYPSLRKEGFVSDGFKAIQVTVQITQK